MTRVAEGAGMQPVEDGGPASERVRRGAATWLRLVLGAAALLAVAGCERVEGSGAGRSSGPYVGGGGGMVR